MQYLDGIHYVSHGIKNQYEKNIRKTAASKIGKSWDGEERVLTILKNKKLIRKQWTKSNLL